MQRLIDANKYREEWLKSKTFEPMKLLDMSPTVLAIPENPTNGDMIKAIFPDIDFHCMQSAFGIISFDLEWWNAPYKAESEGKE